MFFVNNDLHVDLRCVIDVSYRHCYHEVCQSVCLTAVFSHLNTHTDTTYISCSFSCRWSFAHCMCVSCALCL